MNINPERITFKLRCLPDTDHFGMACAEMEFLYEDVVLGHSFLYAEAQTGPPALRQERFSHIFRARRSWQVPGDPKGKTPLERAPYRMIESVDYTSKDSSGRDATRTTHQPEAAIDLMTRGELQAIRRLHANRRGIPK